MAAMAVLEQEIADLAIVEGDEPQPEAMLSRLDELLALLGSTDGPDVVRRPLKSSRRFTRTSVELLAVPSPARQLFAVPRPHAFAT